MKSKDVQTGEVYAVKVSNRVVPVRIINRHPTKGWNGTNTQTGRPVHIKSPQRLRYKWPWIIPLLLFIPLPLLADPPSPSITRDNQRHPVATYQVSYVVTVYSDATLEFSPPTWADQTEGVQHLDRPASSTEQPTFPAQCAAIATSTNQRCRNRARPGSDYCQVHQYLERKDR